MPLQTPINVQASDGTYTNGVLVTWQYGGDISQVNRWDVYRWADGQAPQFYYSVFGSTTSYLDPMNVTGHPSSANTNYHYAIVAYSYSAGSSALSVDNVGYIPAPAIYGTNSSDTINGTEGSDVIYSLSGNDKIYAGSGHDTLQGGNGNDTMSGGNGNDHFVFNTVSESGTSATSCDVITDFWTGQDKINLSAIDAFASSSVNDTFVLKGTAAFNDATHGEVRYQKFDNSGIANDYTMVWIDNDADTGVEMAIRLTGLYNLSASDFIL